MMSCREVEFAFCSKVEVEGELTPVLVEVGLYIQSGSPYEDIDHEECEDVIEVVDVFVSDDTGLPINDALISKKEILKEYYAKEAAGYGEEF